MKHNNKRNWFDYNRSLKRQASIDLYISSDLFKHYDGYRKRGGVLLYSDALIEGCLLVREYFSLALRQTQGFMESIARRFGAKATSCVPDYTTLCRRSKSLAIELKPKLSKLKSGYVIAIDSTGLSLMTSDSWNRHKHRQKRGNHSWHKLHIAIDTDSGEILSCEDTPATCNDCLILPSLIETLPVDIIDAVCADMAYDTVDCRRAIKQAKANQLIPPKANAVHSEKLKQPRPKDICDILKQRDDAIAYIQNNSINGNKSAATKRWKQLTGYHKRSLVESTMARIKTHASNNLKSKSPQNISTECKIKCKLLNILNNA